MPYVLLQLDISDRIATVTINRPDKLNALNDQMMGEIAAMFAELGANGRVGAIILTGAGRAFVAGADIANIATQSAETLETLSALGQRTFRAIERTSKPVIAAVNGFALGGGCELALACHLRVASEHAKFGLPEVKLGLIPGYGGTQRLARLIGESRALEMILSGRNVDAVEAERIGLINRLVDADLLASGIEFARSFSAYSLSTSRIARQAIRRAIDVPLDQGFEIEADCSTQAYQTQDANEGMMAFLEKRKAQFNDR